MSKSDYLIIQPLLLLWFSDNEQKAPSDPIDLPGTTDKLKAIWHLFMADDADETGSPNHSYLHFPRSLVFQNSVFVSGLQGVYQQVGVDPVACACLLILKHTIN